MNPSPSSPHGSLPEISRVDVPCLLCGSVGFLIAVVLHKAGAFQKGNDRLMGELAELIFHGETPEVLSFSILLLITAVVCYGVAWMVLDCAGMLKRFALGVTVLVLLLSMIPTLGVWNIYFSPFLPVVGGFWTWFCSMLYVRQNLMPCDFVAMQAQLTHSKRQSHVPSQNTVPKPKQSPPAEPIIEPKPKEVKHSDSDQKYKPKEIDHG